MSNLEPTCQGAGKRPANGTRPRPRGPADGGGVGKRLFEWAGDPATHEPLRAWPRAEEPKLGIGVSKVTGL